MTSLKNSGCLLDDWGKVFMIIGYGYEFTIRSLLYGVYYTESRMEPNVA